MATGVLEHTQQLEQNLTCNLFDCFRFLSQNFLIEETAHIGSRGPLFFDWWLALDFVKKDALSHKTTPNFYPETDFLCPETEKFEFF